MKISILISLLFLICSCHFYGPVDEDIMKPVGKEISTKELVGTWNIDSISYNFIKKDKEHKNDSLTLQINSDNTFEMKNVPAFIFDSNTSQKNINIDSIKGKWKVERVLTKSVLYLSFSSNDKIPKGNSIFVDLYMKKNSIVLWYSIGDPDLGKRFLFQK